MSHEKFKHLHSSFDLVHWGEEKKSTLSEKQVTLQKKKKSAHYDDSSAHAFSLTPPKKKKNIIPLSTVAADKHIFPHVKKSNY